MATKQQKKISQGGEGSSKSDVIFKGGSSKSDLRWQGGRGGAQKFQNGGDIIYGRSQMDRNMPRAMDYA